ncbi:MAG: hypothetical protein EOP07_19110 [Proteobacteria bacterium]|nr:MAG: hypothetical protein EOP07_19110 [Pseudomonadota bacterium]
MANRLASRAKNKMIVSASTFLSLSLAVFLTACNQNESIVIPDAVPPTQDADAQAGDQYGSGGNVETTLPTDKEPETVSNETEIPVVTQPTSPVVVTDPAPEIPDPTPVVIPPKTTQTIANGRYYIKGNGSGRCLDIPNSNSGIGIQIQIWDCNQTGAQLWSIEHTSDDYYKIANYYGKALEVRSGSIVASAAIQTSDYSSKTYQQFKFTKKADGIYVITIRGSEFAVDVSGAAVANGTKIQVWQQTNIESQNFQLIPAAQ